MLERRRNARYGSLSEGSAHDVELGVNHAEGERHEDGDGLGPQESGVMTLEQEVDNWDENAVDNWESDDGGDHHATQGSTAEHDDQKPLPPLSGQGEDGQKKRSD